MGSEGVKNRRNKQKTSNVMADLNSNIASITQM